MVIQDGSCGDGGSSYSSNSKIGDDCSIANSRLALKIVNAGVCCLDIYPYTHTCTLEYHSYPSRLLVLLPGNEIRKNS